MKYNNTLKGKKVLFLSWSFYQYPEKIKTMLEENGATVVYYSSAPTDNFMKMKLFKKVKILQRNYYKRLLSEIINNYFDYLLMINAAAFPIWFIKELSRLLLGTKKLLYSWDSKKVFPEAANAYKYFDRVFSFDREDCINDKRLTFLPLFWCDDLYSSGPKRMKYDFVFVGFGHTQRYNFLKKIEKIANDSGYKTCFRLYLPSLLHFYRGKYFTKDFPDARRRDFIYKPMSQNQIKKVIDASKIVIDLELSTQTGLTMRTIETLGLRKKLITTNADIIHYDFYNPNNICVVDRNDPVIQDDFINGSYLECDEEVYNKYSLSNWIKIIFGADND